MNEDEKHARRLAAGVTPPAAPEPVLDGDGRPLSSISPKVSGSLAAGAAATIIVFVAGRFGLEIPSGVEGALAILIGAIAGYIIPDNR